MTTNQNSEPLPSVRQLLRGTTTAALVAGVILVSAVLPAEYGIDPTGIGRALGLLRPDAADVATSGDGSAGTQTGSVVPADAEAAALGQTVTRATGPFRTDETKITLGWREGAEIKASMVRGQRFVFSWTAEGGAVDVDMHGEATNAPKGEFTSYWKEDQQHSGHGAFEAPFDGTHGWFWQNFSQTPVTITVKTSGYYQKLGRP